MINGACEQQIQLIFVWVNFYEFKIDDLVLVI